MGGIVDFGKDLLFGSEPEQVGTAQSPGQAWLQGQLKPLLGNIFGNLMGGQGAYNVPNAPQAPGVPDYNVTPYQTPNAPYASPQDMIQGGEMRTAQNLMENFYSGGGGGSAMGGLSGQGANIMGNVLSDLSQGAVGRYAQMQLPYAQMQNQQGRDVWGAQNDVWRAGLNQQNLGYTMGQIPQWQQQTQAMNPLPYAGMYSGTYGSPMIQQGQQGIVQQMLPYAGLGFGEKKGWWDIF